LIEAAEEHTPATDLESERIPAALSQLRGVYSVAPDGSAQKLEKPLTPLFDTTLITNDRNEPKIAAQIKGEILSADRIDIVMAFVRYSGIRKFLGELKRFLAKQGRPRLRLLTTTYTNSTELKALEVLQELGAEIRVSYDIDMTSIARESVGTSIVDLVRLRPSLDLLILRIRLKIRVWNGTFESVRFAIRT
jgi:hypothetical protein